jgi:outer membrane usher protein FimD/PapC
LALALLSLAPALAAPASDPASAVPVPAGLAVPAVPSESARVIVADTLRFQWPPVDSAALGDASKNKDAVLIDAPPSKAVGAGADASDTAAANWATPPPAAPPPPRPRTRQELGKMSREDLFRLAFGRSAPDRPRNLAVRLFGEGRPVGNTEIVYNDKFTAFTFYSMPFSRLLDRLILPEARAAAGDSLGYFSSEVMHAAGYILRVDDVKFELRIAFPPESKAVQFTSLYGASQAVEPRGEELPPASVSFYANYSIDDRAREIWYDYRQPGRRAVDMFARDPSTMNLDGALNVRGWVFESSGWVREPYGGEPFTWEHVRRGDARVVRNFPGLRSQLSVGDIAAGTSIAPGPIAGGARYERNSYFFGNNPNDNLNSVSFFMAEPGEVEVYMDGAFRRRLYLPAGHHRVGGFGGEVGRNRVRLLLRMASGATEEVPFEFILSAPRIMPRGDVRYSLTAGVRRDYAPSPACFAYDAHEPVASADYAYGIHHAVNAGFSAVATKRAALAGAQASFGVGSLGFVDTRALASYLAEEQLSGWRAEASYTADLERPVARLNRLITGDPGKTFLPPLSFALRGHCQTAYYGTRMFDEPFAGANGSAGGISGNFAVSVWRGSISAFGGMNFYREAPGDIDFYPNDYNYGARASMGFGRSYFSAGAGESVRGGVRSPYFSLNSSHAFGTDFRVKNHQFSASVNAGMSSRYEYAEDPENDSMAFDWAYGGVLGWRWSNNSTGAGTQVYSASVRAMNDQNPSASATLRHTYNRARLNANYDFSLNDNDAYYRQNHSVRGQLTGSLMFADGLWALGQQMSSGGGFALVDTRGDLRSARVHINRSRVTGNEMSRSGWLGAAYHNRLTAYGPTEMTLSLTDVPIGAVMEQSRYYAVGGYKQGFALKVGRRAQVIALVPFVDKRGGKPLAHTYLTVEAERDDGGEAAPAAPRAAFTDSDGILQIGGLTPGYTYRVKFRASAKLKDALIHIPDGASGIYELPEVEAEAEE